jgi:hypothetical protein
MLKILSEINQKVDSHSQTMISWSQIINSHSQAIAKIEAQLGQTANTLNREEDGKLLSQPVVNPKGH